MKVLGIGNAIVDVICKVDEKFITQNNLTKSTMKLVEEVEFKNNEAVLQFGGGCQGCGMVDLTLKDGIEKTLVEQIPEVKNVKDLTDHSMDDNAYYK